VPAPVPPLACRRSSTPTHRDFADPLGYAPFGFGYRRCPGEFLTLNFIKDVLRKVWCDHIEFETLALPQAEVLPVGPITVVHDNIGFHKGRS